ncbi:hypothetical protein [Rhizobium rhizosphaerae]|uniref:hypothetical protein n=1 Tax=Xaviernesmea rhizosphaerae TaxID=1672749 RepID=UPI001300DD63|nr:hypothetical protein [Xaviernesmea rhizosphaerae]
MRTSEQKGKGLRKNPMQDLKNQSIGRRTTSRPNALLALSGLSQTCAFQAFFFEASSG